MSISITQESTHKSIVFSFRSSETLFKSIPRLGGCLFVPEGGAVDFCDHQDTAQTADLTGKRGHDNQIIFVHHLVSWILKSVPLSIYTELLRKRLIIKTSFSFSYSKA